MAAGVGIPLLVLAALVVAALVTSIVAMSQQHLELMVLVVEVAVGRIQQAHSRLVELVAMVLLY